MKDIKSRYSKFSLKTLLLIIAAILINMLGRYICSSISLPLWLDSLGTFLVSIVVGPVAGGLVGVISILLNALLLPESIEYAIVAFLSGIVVGVFYPKDSHELFQSFCTAAITTLTTVTVSTPISIILYDGYIGNKWGDACVDMLLQSNNSVVASSFLGQAFIDFPDKVLSILIIRFALKTYTRIKTGREADSNGNA